MAAGFAQENPAFTKGENLLNYFETFDGQVNNGVWEGNLPDLNKYDEADFACLKSMGVDVVRLCCSFDIFTDKPYGAGIINETILKKLDQVCDWAEKNEIYLVIDNHIFNFSNTADSLGGQDPLELLKVQLESVWSQIPKRYKDRSEYIIYEIMNESNGMGESKWYKLQQDIINLIRSYDTKHTIVVANADDGSADKFVRMKTYKDPNLIYTYHFYQPMLFTHQGATWIAAGLI